MFHLVSPLLLPHGIVVAGNLSASCELSCLNGLLYVISGLLAGGSPGFRIVLCCFTHFFGVAMCVMFVWSLCFLLLRHTQFELIQCYHLSSI